MVVTTRFHPNTLLTPQEVADLFGVSTKTVGRWLDRGLLTGVRTTGRHRRIRAGSAYELHDALTWLWEVGAL